MIQMAKTALQKEWYEIVSPELFGEETVAETPAEEPEMVEGRTVEVNLQDLMPSSDKYYMDVSLKVEAVEGSTARSRIFGHEVSSEYISKMVSRRSNRIDAVADVTTADEQDVRVKIVATTIRKTNSSKVNSVRKRMVEVAEERAEDADLEDYMESIFTGDLQEAIRGDARKIYPLREVEIRKTEVQ